MNGKIHIFSAVNGLALNESNKNLKVNFIEYWQVNTKTKEILHFRMLNKNLTRKLEVVMVISNGSAKDEENLYIFS